MNLHVLRCNGVEWYVKHPQADPDMLGAIPEFLSDSDERPAAEQFADRYIGGWHSFKGFTMRPDGNMTYPGDPATRLLYEAKLGDETVRVYESSWVAIVQPDGSFDTARLD